MLRFETGAWWGCAGRGADRVNRGRLGPKDLFGWQANASPERLTRPLVREDGDLVETDWATAMGAAVAQSRRLLQERGPSAIGFCTTGQLFLEEYYTLAAIGHGAIGTNHMDGNTLPDALGERTPQGQFSADHRLVDALARRGDQVQRSCTAT